MLRKLWRDHRGFVLFIVLMFVFRSSFADWNDVPTGSMRPTIIEGDRIFVNKMAYDLRVPFTSISLVKLSDPRRGDIAVFDSKVADKRLIKRVVGIPGDVVTLRSNRLVVNGEPLSYRRADGLWRERLDEVDHTVEFGGQAPLADFGPVEVPEGQYLVLGDSRDNSADSRVIGFVPREEFVGRSDRVVVSLDYDRYLLPRGERFLKALDG